MVYERPQRPGQPQHKPSPATDRPQERSTQKPGSDKPKRVIPPVGGGNSSGGGRGSSYGNGNGGGSNPPPSPWLNPDNEPNPAATASFVEYLRWMRSPNSDYKDATKVQLLQMAEQANYRDRLAQLTQRTKLIAGEDNTFQVKCPWRIRVGGHRGPESILLPAFDALGMPYIPSSTLRGVARCQAIREIMAQNSGIKWEEAEKRVAPYFGSLETENPNHRTGKVIFLDAYPLPSQLGVVAMDIANNIWQWNGDGLEYKANPNAFLSLKEPTFLIGLRMVTACDDAQVLDKVRQWLIRGLQSGIGSQVNTGYGELIRAGRIIQNNEFFRIEFSLKGQLIHGRQKFRNVLQPYREDRQGKLRPDTAADAEVRPVAFKSMLRYWFRVFALGVLEPEQAKSWEATLFGAINPQKRGWVMVRISSGKVTQKEPQSNNQGRNEPCGEQQGILTLAYSSEAPEANQGALRDLFKNLTWLMFHLGGIGQGARRPCYSRQNRERAPWYRGSTLFPDSEDSFWSLPATPAGFGDLFRQRLQDFYRALSRVTDSDINPRSLKTIGRVSAQDWIEAVDAHCRIVVCSGKEDFGKPYALAVLHSSDFKVEDRGRLDYDRNLCGKVGKEVKPSPVWIVDLGDYQVVTVFSGTQNPRKNYLTTLRERTTSQNYIQILPLL